ncbi:MAG: dTDP-glucose 4,6-dehydratase [Planctomycetota bacterium]|jgi:dTDP-glucose 4,6-dehydratase
MTRTILVTGGAGFIGSNFVHTAAARHPDRRLVNLDALTYAGNLENVAGVDQQFSKGDIANVADVRRAFDLCEGETCVVHFAAETHVDRSIQAGLPFLRTNVLGTQVLLDVARERGVKRFLHVSTDEVYGSVPAGRSSTEEDRLDPRNPYSASKAAGDHLVLAAHNTHGFPAIVTRCSNNYGPYQFPEKFVPLMIANAREDRPLPVYGDGLYERDWLYVTDHCEALLEVLENGRIGEIYNIAGYTHRTNLDTVKFILERLGKPVSLIRHVEDRPGHDRRYAPDATKLQTELGWKPRFTFEDAMPETIRWYEEHSEWLDRVRSGAYRDYYEQQYRERLET